LNSENDGGVAMERTNIISQSGESGKLIDETILIFHNKRKKNKN
jgi:hypothetical protein